MTTTDIRRLADPARSAVGAALLLALTAPLSAAEWGAHVGTAVAHSDNVESSPEPKSASLISLDAAAQYLSVTRTFSVDAEVAATVREYFEGDYETDVLPHARVELYWVPIPERFQWLVRDDLGQVALTPSDSLLPADRENTNIFSTGPQFYQPLGSRTRLEVSGLFSDIYYENSEFDNNRLAGQMELQREVGRAKDLLLGISHTRTEYKDQQFGGFDISQAYVGYDSVGRRTTMHLEVGVQQLADNGDTSAGEYFDVNFEHELSRRMTLSLRYLNQFGDSADLFILDNEMQPSLGDTADVPVVGDPIAQQRASVELRFEGARTTISPSIIWSKEEIQSATLPDREILGVELDITRRMSRRIDGGFRSYYMRQESNDVFFPQQDDYSVALNLSYRATSRVSFRGEILRQGRKNAPSEYDENRIVLELRYTPREVSEALPAFYERRLRRRSTMELEQSPEERQRNRAPSTGPSQSEPSMDDPQ